MLWEMCSCGAVWIHLRALVSSAARTHAKLQPRQCFAAKVQRDEDSQNVSASLCILDGRGKARSGRSLEGCTTVTIVKQYLLSSNPTP